MRRGYPRPSSTRINPNRYAANHSPMPMLAFPHTRRVRSEPHLALPLAIHIASFPRC